MPEIATESFCERCGTRYAFEPSPPARKRRQMALPTVGSRKKPASPGVAVPLDPFLAVFRFCLGCRRYTCPACWNDAAAFCATCVPFADAPPIPELDPFVEEPEHFVVEASAWPRSDLWPSQSQGDADGDDSDVAELREAHAESERLAAERLEAERAEAERAAAERAEAARIEAARQEAERLGVAAEQLEAERLEAARVETMRRDIETARLVAERQEAERLEAEIKRLAAERQRLEAERVEAERLEAERSEIERLRR
ncbi:MAG: hypothetical protein ACR2LP_01185, partial [Candidatus Limnocylindrales bacterium]